MSYITTKHSEYQQLHNQSSKVNRQNNHRHLDLHLCLAYNRRFQGPEGHLSIFCQRASVSVTYPFSLRHTAWFLISPEVIDHWIVFPYIARRGRVGRAYSSACHDSVRNMKDKVLFSPGIPSTELLIPSGTLEKSSVNVARCTCNTLLASSPLSSFLGWPQCDLPWPASEPPGEPHGQHHTRSIPQSALLQS